MISIVIPTLNEENVLESTLKILRSCRKHNLEIIISDGGSTDGTVEIAKRHADKIVVYDGAARQTIAMGRNAGASKAAGEYLVFLDADVHLQNPEGFFDESLKFFEKAPAVAALTATLRVSPEYERWSDRLSFGLVNASHFLLNNYLRIGAGSGEFQMVRRGVFEAVGGYREDLAVGEDQEIFRRLAKVGRTHFHPRLLVYHSGRRARKVGWPKLWLIWSANAVSVAIFNRSFNKVWKEIR